MNRSLLSNSPVARAGDPRSSHEAAAQITRSGLRASQQRTVLELVRKYPGRTSAELAAQSQGIDRWTAARRLPAPLQKLRELADKQIGRAHV